MLAVGQIMRKRVISIYLRVIEPKLRLLGAALVSSVIGTGGREEADGEIILAYRPQKGRSDAEIDNFKRYQIKNV